MSLRFTLRAVWLRSKCLQLCSGSGIVRLRLLVFDFGLVVSYILRLSYLPEKSELENFSFPSMFVILFCCTQHQSKEWVNMQCPCCFPSPPPPPTPPVTKRTRTGTNHFIGPEKSQDHLQLRISPGGSFKRYL